MKGIVLTFLIAVFLFWSTYTAMWFGWIYPKNYEYALNLADDASLPQVKADYLKEYLTKVETITGKPRYIFKRPDLNLAKQKIIMQGLITRFEDLAELAPSSMAYQTGMMQLTGQEIDHQLNRIARIFKSGKLRENLMFFLWIAWGWITTIPAVVLGFLISEEAN